MIGRLTADIVHCQSVLGVPQTGHRGRQRVWTGHGLHTNRPVSAMSETGRFCSVRTHADHCDHPGAG
jgi:hypothetical protein